MSWPLQYATVLRALLIMSSMTIVLSQISLTEEMRLFYVILRGVTGSILLMLSSAWMLIAYNKSERAAEEELRKGTVESRKKSSGKSDDGKAAVTVARLTWEDDGTHPSHKLTTVKAKPRVFPFPLGFADEKAKEMYFESGTAPQIGHFTKEAETYKDRLAAALKAYRVDEELAKKRTEAIRKFEYDQRRKQWKRRLSHLKALTIVIILSYINIKLAVVALGALVWSTLSFELGRLMQPQPGHEVRDPFSERWGTNTVARKRPFKSDAQSDPKLFPNMSMSYLFSEDLSPLASVPNTRGSPNPLFTSTDERFAGMQPRFGDAEKVVNQKGEAVGDT